MHHKEKNVKLKNDVRHHLMMYMGAFRLNSGERYFRVAMRSRSQTQRYIFERVAQMRE
jgi:hypothetical protein